MGRCSGIINFVLAGLRPHDRYPGHLARPRPVRASSTKAGRPIAYLVLMLLAAALMSGAGYWGGELLNHG